MSERVPWRELRDPGLQIPAALAGYERARAAYEFGRVIRELREAAGLSERQLAARMGTTQSVVSRLEAGGSWSTPGDAGAATGWARQAPRESGCRA